MYCRNCGKELLEGTKFCPDCGTANNETSASEGANGGFSCETKVEKDVDKVARSNAAGNILIMGIFSLAFSEFGIIGLILALIARGKVAAYVKQYGETTGKATVGKHLSTAGLIVSIVMTVFWAVYIAFIVLYVFMIIGLSDFMYLI